MTRKRIFSNPTFVAFNIDQDKLAPLIEVARKQNKGISQVLREAIDFYLNFKKFWFWSKK